MEVTGEASDNPFMFTGREWDGATGLYYYRARYYSPEMGRFISEDPIGLAGGMNMYAYTDNSPLNFVDPLGLTGVGITVSFNAEGGHSWLAGLLKVGAGFNWTPGAGAFWGGEDGVRLDSISSIGAFVDVPGYSSSLACDKDNKNNVGGAYAGIGASIFYINANSGAELEGPATLYFLNLGIFNLKGSIQVSVSDNGKYMISVGPPLSGFGYGASAGSYGTESWTE